MSGTAIITTRVDSDTADLIDRVAAARGDSRSRFVARAVREAALRESAFLAFVQQGIDDLEAGRTVPHDAVMADLDAMIAAHEARCRE